MASQVENTGGVYFVPAFNGLFAPWWRDDARGIVIGITRYTTKAHIARAVLESMCFQVKDVVDSMQKDYGNDKKDGVLRVDGDLSAMPVIRPSDIETTARGAAFAAGLAAGIWKEDFIFDTAEQMKKATTFRPIMTEEVRKKKVECWNKAVNRSFDLADLSFEL
ncbi:hypothetical protein Ahy_B09g095669 isoform D [Arachis hypogaea]|uniref:Carbohydrate kinase FGGY C-terminal domain-containing protein n=1 Tax=Arachis hypogaea TaxID=3818 RepID=A0A444XFK6_ARAHY|nr:hypothetical protein Ahy_B09g095669 isoform D [Arachis hypogaea]